MNKFLKDYINWETQVATGQVLITLIKLTCFVLERLKKSSYQIQHI